jgi:hypothetical protein
MTQNQTPEVGMGATYGYGSDSNPYTITWVSPSGKELHVTQDEVMVVNGEWTGPQDYVTLSRTEEEAPHMVFTLRKDGKWLPKGVARYARQRSLSIGYRRYYQDPSF